jgi:glyoxylase-like metal-dependent hydrolase (beta-lactamase superfamily II)
LAQERVSDLPQLRVVPRGIEVLSLGGVTEGQVAFFIAPEQALVVAEFLLGTNTGLQVRPSPATHDMSAFAQSLEALERLSIERVLVAHGPPILRAGKIAITAAVNSFVGSRA